MKTNQRGFSLIEIIVAVAILGVVSLGFSTMISQMLGAQKNVQARQDLASLVNEVQTLFAVSTACETALIPGTNFDFNLAKAPYPAPTGAPPFSFNGLPFRFKVNSDTLADATNLQGYELIANRVQLVNALSVGTTATGSSIYKAQMIGQFSPKASSSGGLKDFNTKVLVTGYLTVSSAGIITSCSSDNFQEISKATSICTGLGGTMSTTGKCEFPTTTLSSQALSSICSAFNGKFDGTHCTLAASTGSGGSSGGARWFDSGECADFIDGSNQFPAGSPCRALGITNPIFSSPQQCENMGHKPQLGVPCSVSGTSCFNALPLGSMRYTAKKWTCN